MAQDHYEMNENQLEESSFFSEPEPLRRFAKVRKCVRMASNPPLCAVIMGEHIGFGYGSRKYYAGEDSRSSVRLNGRLEDQSPLGDSLFHSRKELVHHTLVSNENTVVQNFELRGETSEVISTFGYAFPSDSLRLVALGYSITLPQC
jgi:hypothetical protein